MTFPTPHKWKLETLAGKTNFSKMASNPPPYPSFDCAPEGRAVRWGKWVARLKTYFAAYKISDDAQQKAMLLTFGGPDLNDIVDTFADDDVTPADGETHFGKLCTALSNHFNPEANVEFQKYVFRHSEQKTDNIDDFYAELKHLAATCGFHNIDAEIKSQLIAGCKSQKVREKGLANPKLTLTELLAYARTLQLTATQAKMMTADISHSEVHRIQHGQGPRGGDQRRRNNLSVHQQQTTHVISAEETGRMKGEGKPALPLTNNVVPAAR